MSVKKIGMVVVSTWVLLSHDAHAFADKVAVFAVLADPARRAKRLSVQQSGFA